MKLLILGATGATGLEVVTQAIERGHTVTAFVRNPEPLKPFGDRITVICGNVLDSAELAGALIGQDAVLSAFGPRLPISKDDADLLQRFALALTHGMQKAGVRRVVIARAPVRSPPFPRSCSRCQRNGKHFSEERPRLDSGPPTSIDQQTAYRKVPGPGGTPPIVRLQYPSSRRRRFHDQSR